MQEVKKFKIYEDLLEEEYLNNQSKQGYKLVGYDGKTYTFEKSEQSYYYLVEFFFNELSNYELKQYAKRNINLVLKYPSQKKGLYYFFASDQPIAASDRNLKDRYQQLLNSKHRTDKFSLVILFSSFTFFSYLYFKSADSIYLLLLILILALGIIYARVYLQIIKRLSEYLRILEKEGK